MTPSSSPPHWSVLTRACVAQLLSVLGEHVFLWTALPLWVFERTGSERLLALALGAVIAPALLSLPAGAWASRHAARSVLLGCGALRLVLTGLLLAVSEPPLSFRAALPWVLGIAFAVSLVDSFFMPALKAALPDWIPERHLVRANSLLEATDIPAQVLGPPVAVALYARWGLPGAVAAQVVAYAAGLGVLAVTCFPAVARPVGRAAPPFAARLRHTLRCAWDSVVARRTLFAWTAGMMAVGVVDVLMLPFIREALHQPEDLAEQLFGTFGALTGLGMALGAGAASLWEPDVSDVGLLAIAAAVATAALAVFTHGTSVWVCGAALVVGGAGLLWVHVAATTVFQARLPEEARAGMLGLTHTIQAAGLLAGLALGGDLAAAWGIRNTLDGAVALLVLAVALAAATAIRMAKNDPNDEGRRTKDEG